MSRKNGKNLLIVIAVGAVVVKAVRDVINQYFSQYLVNNLALYDIVIYRQVC